MESQRCRPISSLRGHEEDQARDGLENRLQTGCVCLLAGVWLRQTFPSWVRGGGHVFTSNQSISAELVGSGPSTQAKPGDSGPGSTPPPPPPPPIPPPPHLHPPQHPAAITREFLPFPSTFERIHNGCGLEPINERGWKAERSLTTLPPPPSASPPHPHSRGGEQPVRELPSESVFAGSPSTQNLTCQIQA